jgi:hypothetical protein
MGATNVPAKSCGRVLKGPSMPAGSWGCAFDEEEVNGPGHLRAGDFSA